jgi:hypothetical protein
MQLQLVLKNHGLHKYCMFKNILFPAGFVDCAEKYSAFLMLRPTWWSLKSSMPWFCALLRNLIGLPRLLGPCRIGKQSESVIRVCTCKIHSGGWRSTGTAGTTTFTLYFYYQGFTSDTVHDELKCREHMRTMTKLIMCQAQLHALFPMLRLWVEHSERLWVEHSEFACSPGGSMQWWRAAWTSFWVVTEISAYGGAIIQSANFCVASQTELRLQDWMIPML